MSASQQVTGIASGFDTASIVEQLMKIEKIPYDKLDIKKQTEQLKLQAYQAVNTMFLKFRTSVSTLSSQKLWRSKTATSTNDKTMTATANEYAVNGSYSFKVAQLATATQYMSKGFASSKTAFVKQASTEEAYKIGTITMNSAKSRVDTSAKLDVLNGGKGVYRGSVRVTDGAGRTSVIDLSGCDTMDDVVRTLNESTSAQITASIQEGKLHIQDVSGGSGDMKIQNVGTGTTATDLGINGAATDGVLHGRNVYTMGTETALTMLQDGMGVEEGIFHFRVSDSSSYIDFQINVDECGTVGDIINRVNQEIQYRYENNIVDTNGGGEGALLLEGLRFGISEDKNSFALTGTQAQHSYTFYNEDDANSITAQEPATQLGLDIGLQTATADNQEIKFGRVLGDVNSPMLKNLSGVSGNGVGGTGSSSGSSKIPVALDLDTVLQHLNGGKGLDISRPMQIQVREGGSDGSNSNELLKIHQDIFNVQDLYDLYNRDRDPMDPDDKGPTVRELLEFMNDSIAEYAANPDNDAAGLAGMSFMFDANTGQFVVNGAQAGYKYEIAGTLASGLGLLRADSNGTAIEIDAQYYDDYNARKDAVDEFYGLGNFAGDALLTDTDYVMRSSEVKDGKKLATLYQLAGMHGVDVSDPDVDKSAEVRDAIQDLLDQGLDLEVVEYQKDIYGQIEYDNNNDPIVLRTRTVHVDLSSLDFDGADLEDVDVETFIDKVNEAIQGAFDRDAEDNHGDVRISAPQLRVHTYGDRLQWSNMNFQNDFSASGDFADAAGVTAGASIADFQPQHTDAVNYSLEAPMATGYVNTIPVNAANAGAIQLGDLRNGAHLTFYGDDSDTLDIEVAEGKKITFTMGELRDMINTQGSSLNTTLEDYVTLLNAKVQDKLAVLNQGVAAGDEIDFKFEVGDGQLQLAGFQNVEKLVISGAGADKDKTGIGAVNIADLGVTTTKVGLGSLSAATYELQDIEGLGDIKITLGGTEYTLSTGERGVVGDPDYEAALTGDSTLSDLISRLNRELAYQAAATGEAGLKDVEFMVNDAGTGIAVSNNSSKTLAIVDTKDANKLAQDLGLVAEDGTGTEVETYSHHNANSLGRKYLGRATLLSDYMGQNAELGVIKITNAFGESWTPDMSECKTLGDVIDCINSQPEFGVGAKLNDRGDGIDIFEAYAWWNLPETVPTGNVSIEDLDGGTLAKKIGIAGTGTRDATDPVWRGNSVFQGSMRTEIDVMSSDTLESLMYRISEKGGYKTAIVNDGSAANPYRLTISSTTTGEAADFVIESDLDMFGFNQTSRAKDAKVLYGDPNSSSSPIMLSSSTNSNSNAILGLTLDLKSASSEWTTITVDTDKEKVIEEIKNMVQTYNDLNDLVSYLDAYDQETGEPGVLYGDSSIRKLMEDINDMFYLVFNPNQKLLGSVDDNGVQNTWTWMDLGVSLSAKNSSTDGTGNWYSSMDLDLDALDEMVAKNWDTLYNLLAGQRNASNSTLDESVKASASFNGTAAKDFKVDNAINGDANKGSWGINNGFMADGTIAQGQDEYTIYFQKATTISRMSIYHYDADTALKNFTVEYLDAATGKWETLRDISNNSVDANHLGMAVPTAAMAIRIKAASTNAEDGKFRLLDVQVFEDIGLAGQLNNLTTSLGDSQDGFLASRNTEVNETLSDIEDQMTRLAERLDLKEESLWKRFTAMESALSQLQNQSSYFTSMMDSMSTSKKK